MARIVVIRPSYRRAIVRKAGAQGGGGGGGTTDHAALSSNLAWTTSGHTGTSGSGVHLAQFSALGAAGELAVASNVVTLLGAADYAAIRTQLSLGTAALLASDTDTTLAANSDARIATQKAVKAYVDGAVAGLLDLKGGTDCSATPNYPAASKGDAYYVTVAGKIGGASGKTVEVGDVYVASADNAGGTEASVGTSWFVLEHNLTGALVATNNLSDLTNAATARSNLSLGNVENTALSTWAGTTNITTLGTITTGVWHGTAIGDTYISSAATWNAKEGAIAAGTTSQVWRGDKSWVSASTVFDMIGSTRGSVLYRGSGGWAALTPGTSGYPLVSSGAGADPAYAQVGSTGIADGAITNAKLASTIAIGAWMPMEGQSTGSTWTNMPAATTEFLGTTGRRRWFDASGHTTVTIVVHTGGTGGAAGARLWAQYSIDGGSTWYYPEGTADGDVGTQGQGSYAASISSSGTVSKGSAATIAAAAKTPCWWRIVGDDGDGVADPMFITVALSFA